MNETVTLVLLPGLDGTEIFFGPLLEALPHWIKPVVVTYPTSGPNGYEDLLPIVHRAVGAGSCFILGWSFAGPLALMVAASKPAEILGVILCASFVHVPLPGLARWRFAVTAPVVAVVRAFRRSRYLFRGYSSDALRQAKAATWRRVNSRVLAARARAALSVDARPHLAACSSPILYLVSSNDDVLRHDHDVLAGARAFEIATFDGPHLALFTNPAQAVAKIVGFMQALRETDWVIGGPEKAAERLGFKRSTLCSRMEKLGISRSQR